MDNQGLYKTSIKYGTLTGISNFVIFLLIYFIHKNPLGNWNWLGFWIPVLFIILGTKEHRDKDLGGYMTYGRGFGIGLLVTLFTAILFSMFVFTFGNLLDSNLLQMQKDEILAGMQQMDENRDSMVKIVGEGNYDKTMEALQKSHDTMTMKIVSLGQFEAKMFGGLFISLIVAAFMKKKRPIIFEDTMPPSQQSESSPPSISENS